MAAVSLSLGKVSTYLGYLTYLTRHNKRGVKYRTLPYPIPVSYTISVGIPARQPGYLIPSAILNPVLFFLPALRHHIV